MATVLIIEDDPKISRALCVRLKAAGLQAITAYDALQGTTMAVKHVPDLIMLDLGLAAGGGLAVLDRLARVPAAASVPVVALASTEETELKGPAEERGIFAYVEKPYDPALVLLTISQALKQSALQS